MSNTELFIVNFSTILLAWSVMAWIYLWPVLIEMDKAQALKWTVAPQMFRTMALGLLHPALTPGIDMAFAMPTVIADFMISGLAALAVISLHFAWRFSLLISWCAVILAALHMGVSGYFAQQYEFAEHLTAHWYIPVMMGPIMVVSVVLSLLLLLRKEA